jgi:dihydroorotase
MSTSPRAYHFKEVNYWNGQALQQGEVWLNHSGRLTQQVIAGAVEVSCEASDWLLPGVVDLCARLREPGATHKASIHSELRAAIACGITSVLCLPDTQPCIDSSTVVELIRDRARSAASESQSAAKLYPLSALTLGMGEEKLAELATLKRAGCVGASNANRAIANTSLLQRALQYAASVDVVVHLHPLDRYLAQDGVAHDGRVAARLGLSGVARIAETLALSRDLMLAQATGARLHVSRISCGESVDIVRKAKARGLPVSCDVALTHLFLCDTDVMGYRPNLHVQPVLRSAEDRDALRAGLADGTIDAICSDHAPHDRDAKLAPFPMTEAGASTLDALLPLSLQLVQEGVLSMARWVDALCIRPCSIARIETSDWILLDPQARLRFDAEQLKSRGKNSPFLGWESKALVRQAFCLA